MQTEFEFTLPRGYVDPAGQVHRGGRMRLATALDEIEPMQDARVESNESYLPVLLLSRVVTQLGQLPAVTPRVIESLFASDLAYLQELYLRLNSAENVVVSAVCPHCNGRFHLQVAPLGE
ncbi:MAG: phage tail assembly protein [Chloroflexi bacterium]|nr:phage tail assembly protein [Chloroflexota bacterium]MCI0574689.1 phage tail assembly protein [Chloroflexota bacterium]MCI0647418.1 phage tail assembly protein [Chloroflexota bacterium]MCI0726874.1 phage tail assembly protein [Chloroflexota bacterium]